MPSNVLLLHLKQTFLPIIWIFTEGEGDGIESRLPFKIFSTLTLEIFCLHCEVSVYDCVNKKVLCFFVSDSDIISVISVVL